VFGGADTSPQPASQEVPKTPPPLTPSAKDDVDRKSLVRTETQQNISQSQCKYDSPLQSACLNDFNML